MSSFSEYWEKSKRYADNFYSSFKKQAEIIGQSVSDWFNWVLISLEKAAHQLDLWYESVADYFNNRAKYVRDAATPVVNKTYYVSLAIYTVYSTLQYFFSLAPVILPLIVFFNIPFFSEFSTPMLWVLGLGVSGIAGYYKYSSLKEEEELKQLLLETGERAKRNEELVQKLKQKLKELKKELNKDQGPSKIEDLGSKEPLLIQQDQEEQEPYKDAAKRHKRRHST